MRPVISLLIPAHNEERTIVKTIRSLLVQGNTPYEIIVVDDGSKDATCSEVIDSFHLYPMAFAPPSGPLQYKRVLGKWGSGPRNCGIFLLAKENGGKGDALNAGLAFSHGKMVLCIDADCVLAPDTLESLLEVMKKSNDMVAAGGRVLPLSGFAPFLDHRDLSIKSALQAYQELEYGLAFRFARFLFDKLGTTFLISGALGIFRRELLVKLGGYSVNTVGEDMEMVMRIRRYSAENRQSLQIGYTSEAECYTELPWKVLDLVRQRRRWTVGLSDVLWKYRSVAIKKEYSLLERLTYWYYLLFEKFSPHIEFASFLLLLRSGISRPEVIFLVAVLFVRSVLALAASLPSLKEIFGASKRKLGVFLRLLLLLLSFVTVYHFIHSWVRLTAVPRNWLKKLFSAKKYASWNSPTRE